MRVIGTAGHVDHGKSTLVEKLSGINPDRLAEEQSRQMTIDLGFAWLDLPSGETIGIVDVPGHRDFIENMLAGVGGIDAALLVVAADEGIMPQTREHLAILRLLDIKNLLVVLSKIDLIDDPEWIELVQLEVDDLLAAHEFDNVPIIPVSAHSGAGLDVLLRSLQTLLDVLPIRANYHHPRLPIDRVFVVSGFGTVVTGTLSGGTISVGDNIELQPSGRIGRVRGLQSYKHDVQTASPGSRVAVNIAGIGGAQVQRGDVLAYPGQIQPTLLADVYFRQLADIGRPLKHNAEVKVFCGAAESIANVRLLDKDVIAAGETGWLQLRLREATPLARDDRFILRYPSPAETIGGGLIVNAHPGRRHKRFQQLVISDLATRLHGSPGERLALAASGDEPCKLADLQKKLGYSDDELSSALAEAVDDGLLIEFETEAFWSAASWQTLLHAIIAELAIYHQANPLRLGMTRAELRSRLGIKLALLDQAVAEDDRLAAEGNLIRLAEHAIVFSHEQEAKAAQLRASLEAAPFTPPNIADMNRQAGEEVVRALMDIRVLINVSDTIAFAANDYERMVDGIRDRIKSHGEIDAKTLRDIFGTSRKYAIAMLEHLDSLGVTQRIGDIRKAGRNL
ncbi:MAG: selenocysteine-specific translation elongation factor [Chloroflexi bacterium]|nr:selenocysteine-specific translation elongation factor [Chloroflexota bacterium]